MRKISALALFALLLLPLAANAEQLATSTPASLQTLGEFNWETGRFSPVRGFTLIETPGGNGWCISRVRVPIVKNGSPTQTVYAKISNTTGTYHGVSGLQNGFASTTRLLGTSVGVAASGLPTATSTLTDFSFVPCVDVSTLDGFTLYLDVQPLNSSHYVNWWSIGSASNYGNSRYNNSTGIYQAGTYWPVYEIYDASDAPSGGGTTIYKKNDAGFYIEIALILSFLVVGMFVMYTTPK